MAAGDDGRGTPGRRQPAVTAVPAMIALGYGKFARADRIYALVPLEGEQRGDRRRTLVHVDGIERPLVASRSESAILSDVNGTLGLSDPAERPEDRRPRQATLF